MLVPRRRARNAQHARPGRADRLLRQ